MNISGACPSLILLKMSGMRLVGRTYGPIRALRPRLAWLFGIAEIISRATQKAAEYHKEERSRVGRVKTLGPSESLPAKAFPALSSRLFEQHSQGKIKVSTGFIVNFPVFSVWKILPVRDPHLRISYCR